MVFGRANCSDKLLTFDMVERTGVEKTFVVCTLILDFRSVLPNWIVLFGWFRDLFWQSL
jgi:hypothetical protein